MKIYHVGRPERFWIEDCFIAVEKIPVGYCTLVIRKGLGTTEVYVVPEFRDRGVGRQLKMTALEYGFAHGVREFSCRIYKKNSSSLANCLAQGYKICEHLSESVAWHLRLKKKDYRPMKGKAHGKTHKALR